ncbi:unnamed protein product [Acanthoscelides obtectus]|uniref:Uncharacterized protein n=1 Tax=Acanthoscelides obtectus TaxID=200917 RepID=A0A9P0NT15_ACAOB|nr:unnamed protein product [Acanthoscelides obtectus]CAK1625927.1 hypothetical protein AOBTE_LOCUS3474 [Acanthoscelides obtectus]
MAAIRQATIQETKENLHSKGLIKPQVKMHTASQRTALTGLSINTQATAHVNKDLKKCDNFAHGLKEAQVVKKETKPEPKVVILKKEENKVSQLPGHRVSQIPALSQKKTGTPVEDPDRSNKDDPLQVTEYLTEIFAHLRDLETKYAIREDFLENHRTTPNMRSVLVNWLVEIHADFEQKPETLYLCISIVDRYLQINTLVGRSTLQLVGTSALLIASKYEEMYLPSLSDFEYICDGAFTSRQILQMEIDILKRLEFNLGYPPAIQFLKRYSKVIRAKAEHYALSKYFLELALLEHTMSAVKPSLLAAAACCLAKGVMEEVMELPKIWSPAMVHYTTYQYKDFRNAMIELASIVAKVDSSLFTQVKKKYSATAYMKISQISQLNGPLIRKLAGTKK